MVTCCWSSDRYSNRLGAGAGSNPRPTMLKEAEMTKRYYQARQHLKQAVLEEALHRIRNRQVVGPLKIAWVQEIVDREIDRMRPEWRKEWAAATERQRKQLTRECWRNLRLAIRLQRGY